MTRYCSFDDIPLLLRVDELMPILGIGRSTAYKLIRSGSIYSIKIGHQLRIPKQAVLDYINKAETQNR